LAPSGARTVYDRAAVPLANALGLRVVVTPGPNKASSGIYALLQADRTPVAVLLATAWGGDPSAAWRDAVRYGIAHSLRWCISITGPPIRIFDATRTYARRFAQFDLEVAVHDPAFHAPDAPNRDAPAAKNRRSIGCCAA
jgi:hypothetical protein